LNQKRGPIFVIFVIEPLVNFLRKITLALFLLSQVQTKAQDLHFSQFNGSLLNLTPGYTGLFNGDYRIGAIYRSQWQSVPVRYNTFSISGEKVIRPINMEKDMIGVGVMINSDRAGDARYGTNQIYASGSYIFQGREDTTLRITLGAAIGWCQVGFDVTKMTFDSQFDGYAFNNALSTNEKFGWTSRNFADINIGSVIQKKINGKHQISYAFGFFHLTNPRISYFDNDQSRLDFKFTNCLSYITPIKRNTDLILEALLSSQGRYLELIPHASLKFYFDKKENKAVLGGLCFRTRDAVIVRFGYTNQTMQSGISYDVNISRFTPATNRRGGFELFINYIIKVPPSFVAKKQYCPVFM
jgi:type IX secretion system PorP/SprF family membrane protein